MKIVIITLLLTPFLMSFLIQTSHPEEVNKSLTSVETIRSHEKKNENRMVLSDSKLEEKVNCNLPLVKKGRVRAKEWWLYSEMNILPETIDPGKWYRLENSKKGRQLRYGNQRYGINLKWGKGSRNIKIYKFIPDSDRYDIRKIDENLRLNEALAIYVKGGGFLVYKKRKGVNLGWKKEDRFDPYSKGPSVYQWQFRDIGERVRDHRKKRLKTKKTLALYNTVAKAYLVYGDQWGVDLKWVK